MPTCQSCRHDWTYKQMFKKQFNLYGEMDCPYCSEKQYYSARTRKLSSIIPFIIIALAMLGNLMIGPSYFGLILLLLLLPIFFVIFPFFVKLANEEEPF